MFAATPTKGLEHLNRVRVFSLLALTQLLIHSFASAAESNISTSPDPLRSTVGPVEVKPPNMTAEQHRKELGEIARRLQLAKQRWLDRGAAETNGKATILLVMKPGKRGIRRLLPTADPILCLGHDCYVSRGPVAPAERMSDRKALGLSNTFGKRAGSCRNSTNCIFRNVDVGGGTPTIQPIDLRLLRHDRRSPRPITVDTSCKIVIDQISCLGGLTTADYAIWVIPEHVAILAGGSALRHALKNGLMSPIADGSVAR